MAIVLPHTLQAGTPENVNDVQENLQALEDALNALGGDLSGSVDDATVGDLAVGGDLSGTLSAANVTKVGSQTYLTIGSNAGGSISSFSNTSFLGQVNYVHATDRLKDTTKPGWRWYLDATATDRFVIQRAPATAGAPVWADLFIVAANGTAHDTNRGKSIIATTESRTNTAYGTLTTPDQVTVVMPTDGLIAVAYQATWQESVIGAARAAIFVGANQLKVAEQDSAAPLVSDTSLSAAAAGTDKPLVTIPYGLKGGTDANSTAYTGDVTTGQALGLFVGVSTGVCHIFAAAGTYTISVQFKASSGSVTAKNRKLWVWTETF